MKRPGKLAGAAVDALIFFLVGGVYAPVSLARPATPSADLQVNAPNRGPFPTNKQAEPSIAQNPTNPLNIIVGSGDEFAEPPCTDTYPSSCPVVPGISISGFYASFDGGQTFPCQGLIDLSAFGKWAEADPWVTFDSRGNAYYGQLAFDTIGGPPGNVADIFVAKSTDGGCTWSSAAKASGSSHAKYDDKDSIAADANPASPFRDSLYAAWTKFGKTFSNIQIVFNRSTDGGATWGKPQQLSQATFSEGGRTGAVVQVGPDGTVYVVWADVVKRDPQIRIAISHDGGKTFPNKDVKVASLATDNPFDDPLPGASFFGGTGLPSFAVGPDGSLYVSWGRRTGEHTVAMVVKSTDKGLTWGTPVVAGDVVGRSEIFQAVTVDPTGTVQLIFNALDDVAVGTPPGGGVVFYDAYWTESTDGGATWGTPLKISSESSDPDASAFNQLRPQFIGDYISAAADSSHVYAVWTDARNGSTCDAIDAYALGEGPKPNVIQQCPVTFGNTDIYLGKIST
ncbi:MAG: exo-alpha-sialidase [Actinobacteria bacterium]|nr:MAG: exo-alpha-sialidase [Actinomycetota bacterium]